MQPQDNPIDVTDAMIDAGQRAYMERPVGTSTREATAIIYRAMRAMEAARPTVSTDGLVERLEAAVEYDTLCQENEHSPEIIQKATKARLAARQALQRSNAEKDEALRAAVDLVQMYGSTEAHEQVRKALSHSSETSND